MITYKITTMFQADWDNLFPSLFPGCQHCYSEINGNTAKFGFAEPVTPSDLGPLVRVELIS
jgi:hypothetical protein